MEVTETAQVKQDLQIKGWHLTEPLLSADFIETLNRDLEAAYEIRRQVQIKNGLIANMDGTCHHLLCEHESFIEFLNFAFLDDNIKQALGGNYIVNSYGGVINMQAKKSYVCNVHRDVRSFTDEKVMMLNMLVMLDDFTLENGATYLLSGSHRQAEKPSDEDFFRNSDRLVGKKGSLAIWDSQLWHAAGENQTETVRRALTLNFTRPNFKQQLDYPRAVGYERMNELSENARQLIGYYSRVPSSLDEWYQPLEKRFYRNNQG